MSFMYNPFPFDDPKPVNRPELSKELTDTVTGGGSPVVAKKFVNSIADKVRKEGAVIAFDGYTTANWSLFPQSYSKPIRIHKTTLREGFENDPR